MTVKELEQRVTALEEQVKRLSGEVAATRVGRNKNWLAWVEKYAGDEEFLSMFAEAQKLREADRRRTCAPKRKLRKTTSASTSKSGKRP